jgi:hypothetical protein
MERAPPIGEKKKVKNPAWNIQEKTVDASCQVWFNLAKEFQRRRFF